jgi:hypothetical protein
MVSAPVKKKWKSYLRLAIWILFVQFVLLNISAFLYAGKFTRFYDRGTLRNQEDPANIFSKTWRLFNGKRFAKPVNNPIPYNYTSLLLTTGSNKSVECWYAKTDSVSKGTVILFHGLTNSKSSVIAEANEFRYWGYNVLMVDFRGHGGSGGYTSTIGYSETEEVKLAYNWVKQKGESKIILWGTSMGAVAIMKAVADERLQTAALILEMPFGSLHQHMKARAKTVGFPKQPFGVLVTFWTGVRRGFNGFNLNSYRNAEKINCPVLMQWGNNDHLVTRFEVENIFTHIHSTTKKFVVYETGTHSSLLGQDTELWRLEVSNFLRFLK